MPPLDAARDQLRCSFKRFRPLSDTAWAEVREGHEVTVAFTYPPSYSGIRSSFFLQTPPAYTLEALSDGLVLAPEHASLIGLIDRHQALER